MKRMIMALIFLSLLVSTFVDAALISANGTVGLARRL